MLDNHSKEAENKLIEIVKEKEQNDKKLLTLKWVIWILCFIVLFVPIIIATTLPMAEKTKTILCFSGFIPAIMGWILALKIEQIAGYYECGHCHYKYVPTFKAVNLSPHINKTRYMKCPKCGKKSWQKKALSKD